MFPHKYRTVEGLKQWNDGRSSGYKYPRAKFALYDLKADIGETTDVANEHPEIVKRLEEFAEQVRADLGDKLQNRTGSGLRPIGKLDVKPIEQESIPK